ncbi:hypothetical protein RFI_26203 [Reticulomyxa filosa]|uniref:Uncharacterized protein n=1 Tax=Reticulomyxa filosa TaxID=46433 RepID=X6MAY3_RETFI|nr:hypothetical protein RFI_26203 [Reticulomyxa filosa]|eukprot:ETO11173.1 hypothetical protein RFI_26203 [Reticulomyxa filosa]
MWELIFRGVLFPIFDDIHHNQVESPFSSVNTSPASRKEEAVHSSRLQSSPKSESVAKTVSSPPNVEEQVEFANSSGQQHSYTNAVPKSPTYSFNPSSNYNHRQSHAMEAKDLKWLETTCLEGLVELVSLFTKFFDNTKFMLEKICVLLKCGTTQVYQFSSLFLSLSLTHTHTHTCTFFFFFEIKSQKNYIRQNNQIKKGEREGCENKCEMLEGIGRQCRECNDRRRMDHCVAIDGMVRKQNLTVFVVTTVLSGAL